MGMLWDIIQGHIDTAPYPPSIRQIAQRIGVSPQTVSNWKTLRDLPARENLVAVAELTSRPYVEVLNAALSDAGYLDPIPSRVTAVRTPQQIRRDLAAAIANRADLDELVDVEDTRELKAEQDERIADLQAELAAAEASHAVAES